MANSILEKPWHTTGKPNSLGTYTVFFGPGESTFNQVCQCDFLNVATAVSALPDLLEACQDAVRCIAGLTPFDAHIEDEEMASLTRSVANQADSVRAKLTAAIAKATGGQP